MKHKDFEDFLNQKFGEENPSCLDDQWIEAFEEWICKLDPDDWIKFGDAYAKEVLKLTPA